MFVDMSSGGAVAVGRNVAGSSRYGGGVVGPLVDVGVGANGGEMNIKPDPAQTALSLTPAELMALFDAPGVDMASLFPGPGAGLPPDFLGGEELGMGVGMGGMGMNGGVGMYGHGHGHGQGRMERGGSSGDLTGLASP